jgi:hypothetical protein
MVTHLVSSREWHLSTRLEVTWRVSSLAYNTFDELRHVLTRLGRGLNFGTAGRCSTAGTRSPEGRKFPSQELGTFQTSTELQLRSHRSCDECFSRDFPGWPEHQSVTG